MLRDGMHQGADASAFIDFPQAVQAGTRVRANPATFSDHFSHATLFYLSLTPVEQAHVAQAYTFELGKCNENTIQERQLAALANIDAELCQLVAAELGLAVPAATEPPTEQVLTRAVSPLGQSWPVAGRVIGIVTDAGSDPEQVLQARDAITAAGMLAPVGGKLLDTDQPVHRTYATARSVEFDAVVLATSDDGRASPDPRVVVLAAEAFRHAKAIGGWGGAGAVLEAAGVDSQAAGIVHGYPAKLVEGLGQLLANHRVWDRFAP